MPPQVLMRHYAAFVAFVILFKLQEFAGATSMVKPGCLEKCGNITIPYPFGIGKGCYLDKQFELTCVVERNSESLYFSMPFPGRVQVLEISTVDLRVNVPNMAVCYDRSGGAGNLSSGFLYKVPESFSISHKKNKLISIGCDIFASISPNQPILENYTIGCASLCPPYIASVSIDSSCSGIQCCQTTFPNDIQSSLLHVYSINTGSRAWKSFQCALVIIAQRTFPLSKFIKFASSYQDKHFKNVSVMAPLVLDWAIRNSTCVDAQAHKRVNYAACGKNSYCIDGNPVTGGYHCKCNSGYEGNPYLPDGCKDIDECKDPTRCSEGATCTNRPGNYICSCRHGYHINGTVCIRDKHIPHLTSIIPLYTAASTGLLIILSCSWLWLYKKIEKEKEKKVKQKNFERHGGLLLQEQMLPFQGTVDKTKLYTREELEKATDNFNERRILGKGGLGTVYKGMLSDGIIVAVKMSNKVDEDQVKQFINEVFILSQINHRNIVKLLGCCLETQVPLLVYAYISNGTLSHHLHDKGTDEPKLSWENRFRIASDIAGAIAYLHSYASNAIFHRDIKSSNILLDERYRAVVSDFGISKSVPIDKSRLTTLIRGTFGYLDPEYFHSGQFTEKSDVYSFGVVLAELLTGEKAIPFKRCEEGLVMHFLSSIRENRLFEILEDLVVKEGQIEEIMAMAKIAERCLKLNGKRRPTMREVVADLDRLKRIQEEPLVHRNSLSETSSIDCED